MRAWVAKCIYTDRALFRGHERLMVAWWVVGLLGVCLVPAAIFAGSVAVGLGGALLLYLFLLLWVDRVDRYVRSMERQRDGAGDASARFRSG